MALKNRASNALISRVTMLEQKIPANVAVDSGLKMRMDTIHRLSDPLLDVMLSMGNDNVDDWWRIKRGDPMLSIETRVLEFSGEERVALQELITGNDVAAKDLLYLFITGTYGITRGEAETRLNEDLISMET